jgi:hypothetical protein
LKTAYGAMRGWVPVSSNSQVFLAEDFILSWSPEAEKADETSNLSGLLTLRFQVRGFREDRPLRMSKMNEIPIEVNEKLKSCPPSLCSK